VKSEGRIPKSQRSPRTEIRTRHEAPIGSCNTCRRHALACTFHSRCSRRRQSAHTFRAVAGRGGWVQMARTDGRGYRVSAFHAGYERFGLEPALVTESRSQLRVSDFGFLSDFVLRISDMTLRRLQNHWLV
jgi:hypothetical protein